MGITPTLLIGSLVLGAAGTATSVYSGVQQQHYQEQAIEAQKKAEAQRQAAMELDARRRQLEVLRNQQRARALALATTTNQGAAQGSGLGGAYGQISGQGTSNMLGISQNLEIGRNIFAANADLSNAREGMAGAQTIGYIGAGMSSLGKDLFQATPSLGRIGQGFGPGAFSGSSYGSFLNGLGSNGIY